MVRFVRAVEEQPTDSDVTPLVGIISALSVPARGPRKTFVDQGHQDKKRNLPDVNSDEIVFGEVAIGEMIEDS